MGKNFRETLNDRLKDPEFEKVWESKKAERDIVRTTLDEQELTEQQRIKRNSVSGGNQIAPFIAYDQYSKQL